MALPDLVLIHGGGHCAECWDPTNAELRRTAPELRILAVDLLGEVKLSAVSVVAGITRFPNAWGGEVI